MDDDANFCGGRLRLAAFLRVVESNMPQRPSRCKQRMLSVEKLPHQIVQFELLNTDQIIEASSTSMNSPSLEAAASFPPQVHRSASIKSTVRCSPIPTDDTGYNNFKSNTHHDKKVNEQSTAAKVRKRVGKSLIVAHTTEAEDLSITSRRPSRTKKRRVPVNGLAMLRTTTSDGLPEPADARRASPVPIAEVDPIDDSQLDVCIHTERSFPCPGTQPERPSTEMTVSSNSLERRLCSSHYAKLPMCPISKSHIGRTPPSSRQHAHARMGDGFVGSELETAPLRKPQRRGKTASRVSTNIGVAGLRLASGSLPTPTIHGGGLFTATKPFDAMPLDLHVEPLNVTKIAEEPELSTLRNATRDTRVQRQEAERWERAVQSQLSRITAPIRHNSASSGSEALTEQQSVMDDDEDFNAEHL